MLYNATHKSWNVFLEATSKEKGKKIEMSIVPTRKNDFFAYNNNT